MPFDFRKLSGLFINGEWREDGEKTMDVVHKYTGETFASVTVAGNRHVDEAVSAAENAMQSRPLSSFERYEILLKTAKLLEQHTDEIGMIITRENGKPVRDGRAEVGRAVQTFILAAEEGKRIHGESLPMDAMPGMGNRLGFTIRVPVGVIGAIAPFNYPLNLVAHKVAPALAAGNSVVLKPASTTPLSAIVLCHLLHEAGLPAGYINLVIGSGSTVGDALVMHRGVRMITFTGSPSVGEHIKARSGLTKVTLELGNNSPNIVHHDADLDKAAQLLSSRAYAQAGQSCISVQRIYVHEQVYDTFAEKMTQYTTALKVGNPEDESADLGPLITIGEAVRVEEWIQEALEHGAKLLCGGKRNGAIVQPTLLADVSRDMSVVCKEVFGPVASVIRYSTLDEAIAMANDSVYGLQAGIFTNDINTAWQAAQRLEYGGVIINDASSFRADLMPYGGVKQSGIGREGPRYAVEEMTELRNVIFNMS